MRILFCLFILQSQNDEIVNDFIMCIEYSASIPKSTILNEKCMEITSVTVSVLYKVL